jgi:hypothetical protein
MRVVPFWIDVGVWNTRVVPFWIDMGVWNMRVAPFWIGVGVWNTGINPNKKAYKCRKQELPILIHGFHSGRCGRFYNHTSGKWISAYGPVQ